MAAKESVRLAELLASLSLATDIGLGAPLENAQRSALLAVPLAESAGLDESEACHAYYLALLFTVGCTGDEDFSSRFFGEDAGVWTAQLGGASPPEALSAIVRNVSRLDPLPMRIGKVLRALGSLARMPELLRMHCEVGLLLTERLGAPPGVVHGMGQVFERWDGKGIPAKLKGDAIDRAVRVAQLATDAQAAHRVLGTDGTMALVRRRASKGYDPALVEVFCRNAAALFGVLEVPSIFDAVLGAEPGTPERLEGEALEGAVRAMGEFTDMRSRYTRGHSAGVAFLAQRAAGGLDEGQRIALGRAGHLHDIGRAGVVLDIWDKPGRLTDGEWERVRMHTYYTERILARLTSLDPVPALSALAHERLDGSGYHRRPPSGALSQSARLLAAADAYHAMTEPRPHRPPLSAERAAQALTADAEAGRFDRSAVDAVLVAAGQPVPPRRRQHATGLTDREVAVLRVLARGGTNKEIASTLGISAKTVDNHVQHIFEKVHVTTRAAATLFAVQNDIL